MNIIDAQRSPNKEIVKELQRLYGKTLDTSKLEIIDTNIGETNLQMYTEGYKKGWEEASEMIKDRIDELQSL